MTRRDAFSVEVAGLRLAGTLHVPAGSEPRPTVLMIQGSGPADRDADGYFEPIRQTFLDAGIATAAFDKPGCGDSTGDWRRIGLSGRAEQAEAVLDALAALPWVAALGVWGQSQGGWVSQLVAGRRHDLAFAIANSGPSLTLPEQDLYGCEHRMRRDGASEEEIERAVEFTSSIHDAARRGVAFADLDRVVLASARTKSWYGYLTIDDELDWASVTTFTTEGFVPVESLQRVRCPFLAVFGGRDDLLPPWQSARDVGESLAGGECNDATVVVFPRGDHRIGVDGGFAPGYLELLRDWVKSRTA